MSETEIDLLKGVYINRFYQIISVITKKAVLRCIAKAAQKIGKSLISEDAERQSGRINRSELCIGTAQRHANAAVLFAEYVSKCVSSYLKFLG